MNKHIKSLSSQSTMILYIQKNRNNIRNNKKKKTNNIKRKKEYNNFRQHSLNPKLMLKSKLKFWKG